MSSIVLKDVPSRYGDVCGFYLGGERSVLISDFRLVKDLLRKDELSDRPDFIRPFYRLNTNLGIVFSKGQVWR